MIKQYKKIKDKVLKIHWDKDWDEESIILEKLYSKRLKYSPSNTIYDSIFQFKAQTYHLSFFQKFILWFFSMFGFFFLLFKYSLKKKNKYSGKFDFAYYYKDTVNYNNSNKKGVLIELNKGNLNIKDLFFILSLCYKTRLNFSLLSICVYRISTIRYSLKFGITEIWTNMEFSSASGIIKSYCRKNNLVFKNFMHGEKLLALRDSFASFDEFYVWNEHYKNIFKKLKCNSKIIIKDPLSEKKIITNFNNIKTICYFLKGSETIKEYNNLQKIFNLLVKHGYDISIKEHPRHRLTNFNFKNVRLVHVDVDINNIFKNHYYIIAQYSTVLYQAYKFNLNFVLDDMSNTDIFNSLKKRDYFLISEKFDNQRLSLIIDKL